MANYVSIKGVWHPRKEKAVIETKDGPKIYEGLDRDAMDQLKEAGMLDDKGNIIERFGRDIEHDPEVFQMARHLGYTDTKAYLKAYAWDYEKAKAAYDKSIAETVTHKNPERKNQGRIEGGGMDTSGGGKSRYGGYELPSDIPSEKLPQR